MLVRSSFSPPSRSVTGQVDRGLDEKSLRQPQLNSTPARTPRVNSNSTQR
jgi:hypothetical protein